MRTSPRLLVLFLLALLGPGLLDAQKRRKRDEPSWPPERAYSRLFLGGALQDVFARHYDFCGFSRAEGKRDYTPPTIENFLGKRSLRTRVERADIHGGSLMSYVFSEREIAAPLDALRYSPANVLFPADQESVLPEPRAGFDSFVFTKNCGGYLKAALDGGFKPPYAAFAAALDTDAKRSSSVLAMAGSFQSPIVQALGAGDERTTALLGQLWQFYVLHPELRQEAYYLQHFEGVLIKHLTDTEEVVAAEQSVGINVNLPLSASINSSLSHRREQQNSFSASDWETIVYTDFTGPYSRAALFAPLPTPQQIAAYFSQLPATSTAVVPLREAATHRHTVELKGLPEELAQAGWTIANLRGGAYQDAPTVSVRTSDGGLHFVIQGQTAPALFQDKQVEPVTIGYDLVLSPRDGMPELRIPVQLRVNTSAHPLVDLAGTRFELRRRNSGEYAFQWHLTINVEDGENPLDESGDFAAGALQLHGRHGEVLDARVVRATYDARRGALTVTLESERSWPLRAIDDQHMQSLPVEAELLLPVEGGYSDCRRLVTARLAVPRIRVAPAPALLEAPRLNPPVPNPAQG
ncbi:hypothetical protein LEM8419_01357 [Neolewinella maritima]|uniref:Uncharacterized protein n=1 Tax=Neolewinella maritima TaxID=1383882 RepID=A0ABM9B0Q8_9BACT|nr:hypothetical protein [Neolewinella maritima]CAH1000209.1 hypothetical protein LEM8419_01357 [Neolewinella maritima]